MSPVCCPKPDDNRTRERTIITSEFSFILGQHTAQRILPLFSEMNRNTEVFSFSSSSSLFSQFCKLFWKEISSARP